MYQKFNIIQDEFKLKFFISSIFTLLINVSYFSKMLFSMVHNCIIIIKVYCN